MLSASNSIITVISTLVGQMTPLCTIDTNAASGTDWQLDMCATYWLNVGTVVTIGGAEFTVVSYVKNVSITVSGAAQPIGATFNLTAPEFSHGSHRKVEGERKAPTDLTLPFVYLPVPEVTESNEINDDVAYSAKINPIFLLEYDPNQDEIELQQAEIIEPCNEMADFFAWLIEDQQENFERPEGLTRKEWMNFGDPTTWGNDKKIFDQNFSGVELRLTLEVSYDAPCLCESVEPVICAPVTMTWQDAAITSSASGGTKDIKTVDAADGVTPVGTKTIDTDGALTIEIPVGGDPVANSMNAAPLTDAVAGTTKTFTISYANGDPVVVTTVSDSATAFDGDVPDLPSAALNTSNLYKTGVITSFRTGDDGDFEYGNGVGWWTLSHNTDWGHAFRFVGTTGGYTDGTNYFDKDGIATTKALAFPNDEMVDWSQWDQVNDTVPMWYMNPFGNNVPTAPQTGTIGGKNWNSAIDEPLASTQNSRTDWYLPNSMELISLLYWEQNINSNQGLNYKPLDYNFSGSPTGSNWRLWTSSIKPGGTRAIIFITDNGSISFVNPTTASYTYLMKRTASLTDFTF